MLRCFACALIEDNSLFTLPVHVDYKRNIGQDQHVDAQVKLSAPQQQRLIQVTRHYICLRLLLNIQLLPPATDL